jgi:hypothetical protein
VDLIPDIARLLGISQADTLFYMGVLVAAANIVSRLIPDDATGPLGTVQKIAQFIGLHVENRVTKGVTTTDVVKQVVGVQVTGRAEEEIKELAGESEALIPQVLDPAPDPVLTPFERFKKIAESTPNEDHHDAR